MDRNNKPQSRLAMPEIVSGVAFFLVATIIFYGSGLVRPPLYEPLGAGFAPKWLAVILGILALTIIVRAIWRWCRGDNSIATEPGSDASKMPWIPMIGAGSVTIVFVLAIENAIADFVILSSLFLIVSSSTLAGRNWRLVGLFAPIAIIASAAIGWVFSELIFVPLP